MQARLILRRVPFLFAGLVLTLLAGTAAAQSRSDCQARERPSAGGILGHSSPSAELTRGAVDLRPGESPALEGGALFGVRADASIVGPLRVRLEGSATRWDLVGRTYTLDGNQGIVDTTRDGRIGVRQLVASMGLAAGRAPMCAHVLVGAGLYTLGYRGADVRSSGFSLTAGIDVPAGNHNVIQADLHFHMVATPHGVPIGSTEILVAALTVGWAYRF